MKRTMRNPYCNLYKLPSHQLSVMENRFGIRCSEFQSCDTNELWLLFGGYTDRGLFEVNGVPLRTLKLITNDVHFENTYNFVKRMQSNKLWTCVDLSCQKIYWTTFVFIDPGLKIRFHSFTYNVPDGNTATLILG